VHFVLGDLKHVEMLLAESLEMTDIFFADKVAFLEGAALEFARPDLGNVVGKDCPYSLRYVNCFTRWHFPRFRTMDIAHNPSYALTIFFIPDNP
jgi:hypothetical protein